MSVAGVKVDDLGAYLIFVHFYIAHIFKRFDALKEVVGVERPCIQQLTIKVLVCVCACELACTCHSVLQGIPFA